MAAKKPSPQSVVRVFESEFMAVFNCRDYGKRLGREAVVAKYGKAGWNKVKSRMKTGVMELFHHKPTPETRLYVKTVAEHAERFHSRAESKAE